MEFSASHRPARIFPPGPLQKNTPPRLFGGVVTVRYSGRVSSKTAKPKYRARFTGFSDGALRLRHSRAGGNLPTAFPNERDPRLRGDDELGERPLLRRDAVGFLFLAVQPPEMRRMATRPSSAGIAQRCLAPFSGLPGAFNSVNGLTIRGSCRYRICPAKTRPSSQENFTFSRTVTKRFRLTQKRQATVRRTGKPNAG